MLDSNQISSQSIDHMGLVAATIHDLGIIQAIDKLIPVSLQKGARLTMGERVAGMILNGLGFIDTRSLLRLSNIACLCTKILTKSLSVA